MLRLFLSLFTLVLLCACGEPRYNFEMKGADEFVLDSYRIRQGKFSILQMQGIPVAPMPHDAMQEYDDTIAENDVLDIAIFHPTRGDLMGTVQSISKNIGYRVVKGEIYLPQLGSIYVSGLTLDQARAMIQTKYDSEIQGIEVFVEYRERLSRIVELVGGVSTSSIPVDGHIRLYDVLAKAKVQNNANWFMSYVERCGRALPVDLFKLIREGDMCQNIVMRPHDKIFIAEPNDSTAMVMGEVGCPTIIALPHGYIPLREALVASGGIPYTGDKSCIQIIRGSIVCPKVYRLNWNHIITLPNHSLLLMPGDTVYVTEKPITQWNRFIDQLLPTSAGVRDVGQTCIFVGS